MKVFLENKGKSLLNLRSALRTAQIKPLLLFTTSRWQENAEACLDEIAQAFVERPVIVRSAAAVEDSRTQSWAGHFTSVSNLQPGNRGQLVAAIERVIESYGELAKDSYFIVQEQVLAIKLCGVALTCDLDTLAPYYIVNYDESGSNDAVTSGANGRLRTYVRARCSQNPPPNEDLSRIIALADEIRELTGLDHVDIEFAIDQNSELFLLQARPIVAVGKQPGLSTEELSSCLTRIEKKALKISGPHPGLCGQRGIYSNMTDWNPAEMIGIRPRRLALSLYKELITDSTWACQRDNYGYRDLRGFPLLISFLEQPYIDVRASFNSFVPKELDQRLAEKLVDFYIERLLENPSDHDKVEFNILFSCYFLGIDQKLAALERHGFSTLELERIKFSLLNLTNSIISPRSGLYREDLATLKKLGHLCQEVSTSSISLIEKIFWLIQNCKRYGTLPFAGLARAGFIAVQMLDSMVSSGVISVGERHALMASLNTVGKQLAVDTARLQNGDVSTSEFLQHYGHLRPGTYDILSKRYDEAFDDYFGKQTPSNSKASHQDSCAFTLSSEARNRLDEQLRANGLLITPEHLMEFIAEAIEGREYGKFVFTRVVSEVLKLMEELGGRFGISREEMSWVDIGTILALYSTVTTEDVGDVLRQSIRKHQQFHATSRSLKLPQIIRSCDDIYDFFLDDVQPNFITTGRVTEVLVTEEQLYNSDLNNRIVLIKQADPGYDWVFTKGIAGLVTMYGGANSHMAIRCSELRVPAVIGCGEENFTRWSSGRMLEIDCSNKQVKVNN